MWLVAETGCAPQGCSAQWVLRRRCWAPQLLLLLGEPPPLLLHHPPRRQRPLLLLPSFPLQLLCRATAGTPGERHGMHAVLS